MAAADRKDPLQFLTQLRQDIPGWLERVEKLTETANERYAQWVKESQHSAKPPSLKKGRTGSMESLRPLDEGQTVPSPAVSPERDVVSSDAALYVATNKTPDASLQPLQSSQPATPPAGKVDIDPHNRHLFREIREQRRKRKNPSANDGASGPPRFRVRGNFTIWYDSSIQTEFEGLVRNISSARHTLRKAKTAASFKARLGSLRNGESLHGLDPLTHPFQTRNVPRLSQPGNSYLTGLKTGLENYETVDKELESAQTLCEVGAHQFLRDADCFDELDGTKARFDKCLALIVAEIKLVKDRSKLEKAATTSPQTSQGQVRPADRLLKRSISSLDPDTVRIDGPLEVDENDDQESVEIDLMALPGRRHYSSRHLMMNKPPGVQPSGAASSGPVPGDDREKTSPTNLYGSKNSSNRNSTDIETSLVDNILADSGINVPTSESDKTDDDTDFDLTAMRKDSVNRFSTASTSRSDSKDASALTVAKDEPELDLWAMRHSVGYRDKAAIPEALAMDRIDTLVSQIHDVNKVENSNLDVPILTDVMVGAGPDVEIASDPEPQLDLAAMRGAIGRRGPGKSDATIKGREDTKSSEEGASTATVKGLEISSSDVPLMPEFAVDSTLAATAGDENTVDIPDNIADMLKSIKKTSTT